MNKNIFNRLFAVASLAMLAAAKKHQRVVEVNENMLRDMNENSEQFVMNRRETLTLLMDQSYNWELESPVGAPYKVNHRN